MIELIPLILFSLPILTTLEPSPAPAAIAQQVPRVQVSPNGGRFLGFDWDGKNIKGEPHDAVVQKVIITYTNPLLAASRVIVVWDSPTAIDDTGGTTKIPMLDALRGVPSGDWDCTAQLEDVTGQRGPPSTVTDKTRFTVHADPPTAPQNVGVQD